MPRKRRPLRTSGPAPRHRPTGYGRQWKKWLAIYAVAGVVIYLIVYLVFFSGGGGGAAGGGGLY